jgi:hypothetical protein
MAIFQTTIELSYQILQIIETADQEIILVTPYLKLSSNLKDKLSEANRKGKEITLIYGKSDLSKEEKTFLDDLDKLTIYFHENLHAKCYFNEYIMLITSMNLHEFSEKQNKEFGIFIDKETDDIVIYEDVLEEVHSIIQTAMLKKESKSKNFKSFVNKKPIIESFCDYMNNSFQEKRFRVEKFDDDFGGRAKAIISENFLINVDILIDENVNFILKLSKSLCEKLFKNNGVLNNIEINNEYRIYWNPPYDEIKVYKSIEIRDKWDLLDYETKFKYYKRAIELVTTEIEREIFKLKHST